MELQTRAMAAEVVMCGEKMTKRQKPRAGMRWFSSTARPIETVRPRKTVPNENTRVFLVICQNTRDCMSLT